MKKIKIKIKPLQYHERKMTSEELDNYLKMKRRGSSFYRNKKKYNRKEKYKNAW